MRQALAVVGVAVVLAAGAAGRQSSKPPAGGVSLSDLSWVDAEPVLTASAVVVIPLGAGVLEQGPHLKLNSDERLARYLASRVQAAASVVIAPPLTYHAYPEFAEYPGTASLTPNTAAAMTVDVVRGLAKHGPRRFYVLNTEPSALAPLSGAAKTARGRRHPARIHRPEVPPAAKAVQLWLRPLAVGHADEITTSMMLFVDPSAVDMTRAAREYASGSGVLTRQEAGPGVFSKSGVLGDATVATRANGQVLVETLVAGALEDIEAVRNAPLPAVKAATPPPPPPRVPAPRPTAQSASESWRPVARRARNARSGRSVRRSARCGGRWTP